MTTLGPIKIVNPTRLKYSARRAIVPGILSYLYSQTIAVAYKKELDPTLKRK